MKVYYDQITINLCCARVVKIVINIKIGMINGERDG
jgi:hypothetical protein